MNNYKRYFLITGFLFGQMAAIAQVLFNKTNYPQGYFRNPLSIPINLAGNFGELRPNHYHMGMDIKTAQKENLPVYAAADGYVAHIKIEPGGFGRAIYINHPNGFTTVYCHLNDFTPKLETYLKQQQYKLESWQVFLDIPPGLFPVKKGDFIAYSGNSGGSQGPHLHFEIRTTATDVNVNPQLFGLPLTDNTNPVITRLGVYDRQKSIYEQAPKMIMVKKISSGEYVTIPSLITVATDKISFAISTYDTHTGSSNQNGIYESTLYDDGKTIAGFRMDNISYDDTRYLNAHIDYRTKASGGPYLQHLSELPGYINSIYKKVDGNSGVIDLSNGKPHTILITAKDAAGNISKLQFKVQYNGAAIVRSWQPGKMFYPFMLDVFDEAGDCEFYIGEKCLYDSVHIRYAANLSSNPVIFSRIHTIGDTYIPLQDSFMVRIKPSSAIPADKKQRIVMQRFAGDKKDVQKVAWQNEWASARFRDFGNFQLVLDETPPQVVPINFTDSANLSKAGSIAFTIKDNLEKFKNVRATLDGKWLRFTNDKGRTFIYRFDEMCSAGEHTLIITAQDEVGNETSETYRFTR